MIKNIVFFIVLIYTNNQNYKNVWYWQTDTMASHRSNSETNNMTLIRNDHLNIKTVRELTLTRIISKLLNYQLYWV